MEQKENRQQEENTEATESGNIEEKWQIDHLAGYVKKTDAEKADIKAHQEKKDKDQGSSGFDKWSVSWP